jgi:iron(III) transport system permease protein
LRGALLAAPLLFPPMVYVFGWQRILPPAFPGVVACVGVWALWAYPIPALLLGAGWARRGRGIYEAAVLDTSPIRAVVSVVLPVSARTIAAAATVLWVLFLGEYSVPHACGLSVYATELLGWAEDSAHAIDPFWLSLPLAGLMLVVVVVLGGAARWRGGRAVTDDDGAGERRPSRGLTVLAAANFVVAALVPIAALAVKLLSLDAMCRTFQTYRVELAQSLAVTGLSGLLAVLMGIGLTMRHVPRRGVALWVLGFAVLPGALVGEAVLAAYRAVPLVYDYWPLVVVGYVARFGWIGLLTAWLAVRGMPADCVGQARTDGADEAQIAVHVAAAHCWPTLLFGACLTAAFALVELPTSSLVRVPSVGLIAQILLEKFHRAEDGMLMALSLWLVLAAVPAALLLAVVLRRRRGAA